MRSVMEEIDWSKLDQLDLNKDATVWWEGPSRSFTKLSSAIRCVVEDIAANSKIPPGITIFDSPYFLEIEQIDYLYKNRLATDKGVDSPGEKTSAAVSAKEAGFNQSEIDQQFDEAIKELGAD
jgi:hypothetical protein